MKRKILVIGLNPAWQKILVFEDLVKGEINRAVEMLTFASGKGANFAKITEECGNKAVLAQFVGGRTGDIYCSDLKKSGLTLIDQEVEAPTRTCITLLSSSSNATELIEPSGRISNAESSSLLDKILKRLPLCDGVAICGTYPPGVSVDFYLEIAKLAKNEEKPFLLDSYKGILPVLSVGADILKINRRELAALSQTDDIYSGGEYITEKYPVKNLAITDGSEKAYHFSREGCKEHRVSSVENVINPIGAGDTVSAVLFSEYLKGTDFNSAFKKALKTGSESCRHLMVKTVLLCFLQVFQSFYILLE